MTAVDPAPRARVPQRGPCDAGQLLGYDIQLMQPVCATIEEPFFDQQSAAVQSSLKQQSAAVQSLDQQSIMGGILRVRRRRSAAASDRQCGARRPFQARQGTSLARELLRDRPRRQRPLRIGVVRSPLLVRCGSTARVSATYVCRSM